MNLNSFSDLPEGSSFLAGLSSKATPPQEVAPVAAAPVEPVKEAAKEPPKEAPPVVEAPKAETPKAETPEPKEEKKPEVAKPAPDKKTRRGLDNLEDEPTKAAATTDDDDAPADATTPEAKNAWSTIKAEVKALRKQLEEKSRLADNDPIKAEVEQLRKERETLQEELAKTDFTRSKEYQEAIVAPLSRIEKDAEELAKTYEIDVTELERALLTPDRKKRGELLDELTESMTTEDKMEIFAIARQVRDIHEKREFLEKNAAAAAAEAARNNTTLSEKQRNERRAAEMRAVVELKPKTLKAVERFHGEGETPESAADRLIAAANEVPFDELATTDKAEAQWWRVAGPEMYAALKGAREKIASLEREIRGTSAATPRTDGGTAPQVNPAAPEPATAGHMGYIQAINAKAAAMAQGSR